MTLDAWLARHPYLQPVAALQARVDDAAAELDVPPAHTPRWDDYADDFHAGVPILQSARAGVDLSELDELLLRLVHRLGSAPLPGNLADRCRELEGSLRRNEDPGAHAGLIRYLRGTVLPRHLSGLAGAFAAWRDDERWLRNYCPVCGEPPAMAQLAGKDPGRLRLLSCGCCRTRWRYRRTGCPFCEERDDHVLSVVDVEGENGLRIDYCNSCRGYLKTYDGEGSEHVLLADWTSLHLDFVARTRGLKRLAASLYDV
jgi:FdhE protein